MKNSSKLFFILLLVVLLVSCGANKKEEVETSSSDDSSKEVETVTEDAEETKVESKDTYNGEVGKITVYISGPENMISKLEQKFEETRGDVIDIYHAGCGPLRQKVWTEAEANNIQADVFWGSNPLIYYMLDEKGLLAPYELKEKDKIIEDYQMNDVNFALTNLRYEIIVYDKQNVAKEDAPKSYSALTEEKWKDKLAYTDLSQSSTAFALSSALWEINDKSMSFFEGIKKNNALIVPKSKSIAEKIQSGEIEVGILPFDAILRLNKKAKKEGFESRLAASWPEEGAIQMERPIAIIKNDARPEENQKIAEEFVDFILSKETQSMMMKFGFNSVRNDVEALKGMPENFKYTKINWKELVPAEKQIREEFKSIMLGE